MMVCHQPLQWPPNTISAQVACLTLNGYYQNFHLRWLLSNLCFLSDGTLHNYNKQHHSRDGATTLFHRLCIDYSFVISSKFMVIYLLNHRLLNKHSSSVMQSTDKRILNPNKRIK